ncbi:hypothetical protein N0V84_010083 [Fusarium piperis]|uniref:Aminoglycoside phosphotransferase domain-containing protein n=1 Tax=Fusarium piperis TaxID=1435070 RepID=A0A9W8W542_9HYPO|nr:hypothetical protein N0V84_010083 [Fusarium piperis]
MNSTLVERTPVAYTVLFSAPQDSLPAQLPTPEEIEHSAVVIAQHRARCTAQLGSHYIVKFGTEVEPIEGENMDFVRQQAPAVDIPKLYAIYQREVTPRTTITYIIMENVGGESLDVLWGSLNAQGKTGILNRVRDAYAKLREIRHLGYFGSINMTKPRDDIFWDDEPIRPDSGTFSTEAEFIQALVDRYLNHSGGIAPPKVEYHSRILPNTLKGTNEPVFTHNGLKRTNIIVSADGRLVILGWASAGWYPSYWEYSKALDLGGWTDDWHKCVGAVLEEYPNQHEWMGKLRSQLSSPKIVK